MKVRILRSGIHGGEESVVSGNEKAGMVVFSGCHLACSFCYTPETSRWNLGQDTDAAGFSQILEKLLACGARNINLISPTHVWNAIEPVLKAFKQGVGKDVPLVLKFSGFESPALIRRFATVADVLVPDFKLWDAAKAVSVSLPARYGAVAQAAVKEMVRTHGEVVWNQGSLRRGIVLRHLLMPDFETDSEDVISALDSAGYRGWVNFMTYFISLQGKPLKASAARVEKLCHLAQARGMQVLVDGEPRRAAA